MILSLIKKPIKAFLNPLGYDIRRPRRDDESLYEEYDDDALNMRRFYNVGSGDFFHRYWTNIDYASKWYAPRQRHAFVEHDLMSLQPLPIPDCGAELIYTSHTIEHLSEEAVQTLLNESFRSLRPGGLIRITCPDANLLYLTLKYEKRDWWNWRFTFPEFRQHLSEVTIYDFVVREVATARCRFHEGEPSKQLSPETVRNAFHELDYVEFHDFLTSECEFSPKTPGYHISWWDKTKLVRFLKIAGFDKVHESGFGKSIAAPLQNTTIFDHTKPVMSLYVDAIK